MTLIATQERSVVDRWPWRASLEHERHERHQCPFKRDSCLRTRKTKSLSAFCLKHSSLQREKSLRWDLAGAATGCFSCSNT